jgi:hypothetical protein
MKQIIGIIVLIGLPVFGPGATIIVIASLCAYTAYQGFRTAVVYGSLAVLVGIELLYGLHGGVFSLSYLTAVLLMLAFRRSIALPAWASRRGWRLGDAVQATVISYVLFWITQVFSVLVLHIVYGYGQLFQRLAMMARATDMRWALVVIVIALVVSHRIDEPFRHPIHFGT